MVTMDGAGEIVQVGHKMMARFTASGKAMAGPLAIDTEMTPFVVTCGDEFVGMIMPVRWGDGERDKARDRQGRWGRTADRLANAVSQRQAGGAVPALLVDAIRSVGNRQVATVVSLAESLSVDKATATDLLEQMYRAGLIGPPKRGKSREVMFSPEEVDRALAGLAGEDDEGPEVVLSDGELVVRAADEQPPDSPFSDPPMPPEPWTDSDGNPWPTSPFSDDA